VPIQFRGQIAELWAGNRKVADLHGWEFAPTPERTGFRLVCQKVEGEYADLPASLRPQTIELRCSIGSRVYAAPVTATEHPCVFDGQAIPRALEVA
jgi:hypothetical protein